MKSIIYKLIIVIIVCKSSLTAQVLINAHSNFNYWKHSELFGSGIGLGISYKLSKLTFSLDYEYGYGSINRIDKFDNVDYNKWSTVFIKTDKGKWNEFIGEPNKEFTDLKVSSDYGKQNQISLNIGYEFSRYRNAKIVGKIGLYAAIVEQFFTFKNIQLANIDISPFYNGSLNYIPSTSQKILTCGVNFELEYINKWRHNEWGPFISIGIGPKYSSYASIGLRLSTELKRK